MSRITSAVAVFLALTLMAVTPAWGQAVTAIQLRFPALLPSQTGTVNATAPPGGGNITLYYWIVTRYPIGATQPRGPAAAIRTLGIANLAKGPVVISWQAMPGATGYDVIRGTTPSLLANACVGCVVSSNQSTTTFTDNGGGVVNWPTAGTIMAASKILTFGLNNRDDSYPFLEGNGEFHISPARSTLDYSYLFEIFGPQMTGGAAQKTYALGINVTRPTTAVATGDSNDALVKGSYSNYAKNDANFIVRGINTAVNNRSPGTLGMVDNLISVSNKSGATSPVVNGLTVNAENFGVNATQHSGIDVSLKNEAAKATKEWGIRFRNLNNSIAGPSDAVLLAEEPALVNTGWNYIIDANGVKSPTHAFARLQNGSEIYFGTQTTRDTVRGEVGIAGTIGSFYMSSAGKMYLKVANANATTDWQLVTATAAD